MINIKSFGVKRKDGGSSSSSGSGGGYANTTVNTTVNSVKIWGQPHDHTSDVDGDITTSGSITAQGNVTATDITAQGNITSAGSVEANSIHSHSTIEASGAISGDDGIFTGDVSCVNVNCSNINCAGDIEANTVDTNELTATDGTITNLVTDFLTVTKQAHFFELIIDKLKSNSGQVILSAANAKIDKVKPIGGQYMLFWRKKDPETNKAIDNEFVVNDQVRCQTFNVQEGTNYNANNKYYWWLVVEVGTMSEVIDTEEVECNYVLLSETDKDGTSIPEVGDEIVQLGNRTDTTRQSAIILSSIASIDSNVQAPSIVQYTGINSYTLDGHILNQMAANGNTFTGDFKVITGNTTTDVKDLVSGTLPTIVTNSDAAFIMANSSSQITSIAECQNLPTNIQLYEGTTQIPYSSWTSRSYIKNGTQRQVSLKASVIRQETGLCVTGVGDDRNGGCNVTWSINSSQSIDGTVTPVTVSTHNCTIYIEYTDGTDTKTITKNVPLNVITSGSTVVGADAEFDKMKVNDCDLTVQVSNVLNITADVQVQHVKGSTVTTLSDVTDFTCSLKLNNSGAGAYYTLTRGTDRFTLSQTIGGFMDLTNPPTSAILTLTKNGEVVDTFVAAVKFNAGAMFQVRDNAITAAVQQSNTYTDNEITTVNADIAQLQVTANNISTRVTNIEGDYVTSSELTQTANNIQLNVYNELNEKTGIDVRNGQITLNADNTTINGNLNLNNTDNGITIYDEEGTPRIQLQPNEIGSIEDFDSGTSYIVKSSVRVQNATTYTQSTQQRKIGYFNAGDTLTMKNVRCLITSSATTGEPQYPTATFTAVINIYKEGNNNPVYTFNRTFTYNNGEHTTSDISQTIATSGVYLFNADITYNTTPLPNVYEEVRTMVTQTITHQTYIGSDGFYCNPYSNAMLWAGSEEIQMRWGYDGIRVNEEGLQRLPPNYIQTNELWLPFDNISTVTSIISPRYTLNGNNYEYTINPLTDKGLLLASVPSYNISNRRTHIYLPDYQLTIDGKQYYLPHNYMVHIKNAEVNNINDGAVHQYNDNQRIFIHLPNGVITRCLGDIVHILHNGNGQWLIC